MKEASEVPNFLEEVDKCRKLCSADGAELSGEFLLRRDRRFLLVHSPTKEFVTFKWMDPPAV